MIKLDAPRAGVSAVAGVGKELGYGITPLLAIMMGVIRKAYRRG